VGRRARGHPLNGSQAVATIVCHAIRVVAERGVTSSGDPSHAVGVTQARRLLGRLGS